MSFILEALKKSEKNRQQTCVPSLNTQHNSSQKPARKRSLWSLWPGLLLTLLILNALTLLWLFGPWAQLNNPDNKTPKTTATPATEIPDTVTNIVPAIAQINQPQVISQQKVVTYHQPSLAKQTLTKAQNKMAVPTEKLFPHHETSIVSINELPAHIRQQLPPLHMSVHAYTGDSGSLIRLNNKIMHQGNTLDGCYLIEQITANSAILRYQGYRFEILRKGH